jgi:hypothetical protein
MCCCSYGFLFQKGVQDPALLPRNIPLQQEISRFEIWARINKIQLDRPRPSIMSHTFETAVSCISLYCGYALMERKLPPHAYSLKLFSNQMLWMEWIRYLQ